MARDEVLTFSNRQSLSVPADGNLTATNSTNVVPRASLALIGETTPAAPNFGDPNDLVLVVVLQENTGTPVAVQGQFKAELQLSIDDGSNYDAIGNIVTADPCLPADGIRVFAYRVGTQLRQRLASIDPTLVQMRVSYSTTDRTGGDAAATVLATAYLTTEGGLTGS